MIARTRTTLALLLAFSLAVPAYAAESVQLVEQQIKAGLLYNFLRYTQWPAERMLPAGAPVSVCLFGGDPFGGHLQPMAGRTVNQQTIEVRTVRTIAESELCSLLFVHAGQAHSWPELQRALAGKSVLTVSDFQGFAASGGIIEFTRVENRIGVLINTDAAAAARLEVQDRLLRLARTVKASAPVR